LQILQGTCREAVHPISLLALAYERGAQKLTSRIDRSPRA
jgi:hypothetical protein